jgi:hypothetical protein
MNNISNGTFNCKIALKSFIKSHNKFEKAENFNKNITKIISEIKKTKGKIAIVSDFDYTLTRKYDLDYNNNDINNNNDKEKNKENLNNFYLSSYGVFENNSLISEEFRKSSQELFENNYRYETDLSMDFDKRNALVLNWYKANLNMIVKEDIKKSDFEKMIDESHEKFYFRNGIIELFEIVLLYKIPFFIISGGLYDIIDHALKASLPFYDDLIKTKLLKIISNRFEFDEITEKIIKYHEPIIYTFNKGEVN